MKNNIEIETKLNKDNYYTFNLYNLRHKSFSVILFFAILIMVLSSLYEFILFRNIYYILFIVLFIAILLFNDLLNIVSVKAALRKLKESDIVVNNKFVFKKDSFVVENEKGKESHKYTDIYKYKTNRIYIYIFMDKANAFIIETPNDEIKTNILLKFHENNEK